MSSTHLYLRHFMPTVLGVQLPAEGYERPTAASASGALNTPGRQIYPSNSYSMHWIYFITLLVLYRSHSAHCDVINFVLVGATGDLARKYLWESVFIQFIEVLMGLYSCTV